MKYARRGWADRRGGGGSLSNDQKNPMGGKVSRGTTRTPECITRAMKTHSTNADGGVGKGPRHLAKNPKSDLSADYGEDDEPSTMETREIRQCIGMHETTTKRWSFSSTSAGWLERKHSPLLEYLFDDSGQSRRHEKMMTGRYEGMVFKKESRGRWRGCQCMTGGTRKKYMKRDNTRRAHMGAYKYVLLPKILQSCAHTRVKQQTVMVMGSSWGYLRGVVIVVVVVEKKNPKGGGVGNRSGNIVPCEW